MPRFEVNSAIPVTSEATTGVTEPDTSNLVPDKLSLPCAVGCFSTRAEHGLTCVLGGQYHSIDRKFVKLLAAWLVDGCQRMHNFGASKLSDRREDGFELCNPRFSLSVSNC